MLFSPGKGCGYPKEFEDKRAASPPGSCLEAKDCTPGFVIDSSHVCIDECPEDTYAPGIFLPSPIYCSPCSDSHISSNL